MKAVSPFLLSWCFGFVLPVAAVHAATEKQADVIAYCRSVNLQHATSSSSGVPLDAYFTTYDGRNALPLADSTAGYFVVSGELSPETSQAGLYRTDYILLAAGSTDSYGTAEVRFPTTDTDANTVPDFLQLGRNGTVDFSGTTTRQAPSPSTATLSGRIVRNAGTHVGSYTATVRDGARTLTYSGNSYLLNALGKLSYQRAPTSTGAFAVSVTDADGSTMSYTSESTFTVISADRVSFPQVQFRGSDGSMLTAVAFTLTRTGNRYAGEMELLDGGFRTSWRDYQKWRMEVTDTNDYNRNGVPDLTDVVIEPPQITAAPQGRSVNVGASVTFTVGASGTSPLQFQWRKGGANIPFATGDSYTLANAQLADAGRYQVQVSNAAGTVMSPEAVLEVKPQVAPPGIVRGPQGQTVVEGSSVTLSVVAGGTPPFAYQWRRNGADLPGATVDRLTLSSVTPRDSGEYSVVVYNSAGQATSGPATLTVQLKPPVPTAPAVTLQPASTNLIAGGTLRLEARASGTPPLAYQWWRDAQAVSGGTNLVFGIDNVTPHAAGSYVLVVRNAAGEARSEPAVVVVQTVPSGPTLTMVRVGAHFELRAQGRTGTRYVIDSSSDLVWWTDWRQFDHPGATVAFAVEVPDASRRFFRMREVPASPPQLPVIVRQPVSVAAFIGETVQFIVEATGQGPLMYQWKRKGTPILGANASTLTIPSVRETSGGIYTVVVSNALGSVESAPAELFVETE